MPRRIATQIRAHLRVTLSRERQFGQVQGLRLDPFGIRHGLLHQGDQVGFHPGRVIQTAGRGILYAQMYIDRDNRVIAGAAQRLEISENPAADPDPSARTPQSDHQGGNPAPASMGAFITWR